MKSTLMLYQLQRMVTAFLFNGILRKNSTCNKYRLLGLRRKLNVQSPTSFTECAWVNKQTHVMREVEEIERMYQIRLLCAKFDLHVIP